MSNLQNDLIFDWYTDHHDPDSLTMEQVLEKYEQLRDAEREDGKWII